MVVSARPLLLLVAALLVGCSSESARTGNPSTTPLTASDSAELRPLEQLVTRIVESSEPRREQQVLECYVEQWMPAVGGDRAERLLDVAEAMVAARLGPRRVRRQLAAARGHDVLDCVDLPVAVRAVADSALPRSPAYVEAQQQIARITPEVPVYARWGIRFLIRDWPSVDMAVWDCYNDWLSRELGPAAHRQLWRQAGKGEIGKAERERPWTGQRSDESVLSFFPPRLPMLSCADVRPEDRPLLDSILRSSTLLQRDQPPPPKSGTQLSRSVGY
jgi:hypothetical protein